MSTQKAPDEHLTQESLTSVDGYRVYAGHVVSPLSREKLLDIEKALLVVDSQGKIVFVGDQKEGHEKFAQVKQRFDFGRKLIIPGLIDMHVHLPQMTEIGRNGEHLLTWLEKYIFPSEARFSDVAYATRIASWFFDELLRNGTTTAAVYPSVHAQSVDA
ncbi:MAG: amidohydrolase family protein, partial [Cyanobacteria bacterium]|nr:amidohydrolase family protein [Cyanobacteriota bacterium]